MGASALLRGQSNVLEKDYVIISSLIKDINPHILLRSFTSPCYHTLLIQNLSEQKPFCSVLQNVLFEQHICVPVLKVKILAKMSKVAILESCFSLVYTTALVLQSCSNSRVSVFHCNDTRNYPVLLCSLALVHYLSQSLIFTGFQDILLGIPERYYKCKWI